MSIYEDVLNDFFKELEEDGNIPNEIIVNLEEKLKNEQIKSNEIVNIIKRGSLDAQD